jgi:hypothetical protein
VRGIALWVLLLLGIGPACAEPVTEAAARPTVYVARRGWHIDVGFAAQDLREPLRSIARNFPEAKFVFFGFGDMHYLADEKNQHGPAMIAALWPGKGIILVTTLQSAPADAFGSRQVIELSATDLQLQHSQDYIWNSLTMARRGAPQDAVALASQSTPPIGPQDAVAMPSQDSTAIAPSGVEAITPQSSPANAPRGVEAITPQGSPAIAREGMPQSVEVYRPGPYEGSYYFLATPKYSGFHTCNTWAAQALRAAGFPIRAQGVLFAHQLWSQVRRTHQLQGGLVPS